MCGFICTITRPGKNPKDINKSLLNHRGPDVSNQINFDSVCIRHWRLSIVDLSTNSDQPIIDDKYIFVYNGEIYNYKSISKKRFKREYSSDTLLFFDLLKVNSKSVLQNSSGFFSYLLLDKKKNILSGGRDLLGKKPLYFYKNNEIIIFSSEETAIKKFLEKKPNLNISSILTYISFKNQFFGNTYFKGIEEFSPGSTFSFDINKWKLEVDYSWNNYYKTDLSSRILPNKLDNYLGKDFSDINKNLLQGINNAIKSRFNCDVPLQLALSGGGDSSLIAYLISKNKSLLKMLTRSLTIQFDHEFDESYEAKIISDHLGIKNQSIIFANYNFLELLRICIISQGSLLEHPHSLSYFLLCRETQNKGKVLLTGEGADELFFGYSHYKENFNESFAFRSYLDLEKYFETKEVQINHFRSISNLRKLALSNKQLSRDLEMKTHLLSLLRRNDRMSMANSVEIRAPFLDLNLINFVFSQKLEDSDIYNKKFLFKYLTSVLKIYKKPENKIGFHVPFDIWFGENSSNHEVQKIIKFALSFLDLHAQLKIKKGIEIKGKLAWILCNIGIFAEEFL